MPTVSRERFATALDRLDTAEFGAFVAAVYRGRGRTVDDVDDVTADGDHLTVDGQPVAIHTGRRRSLDRTAAPTVVTARRITREDRAGDGSAGDGDVETSTIMSAGAGTGTHDGAVIDADDLYDWALFGVDADVRTELFAHLDCEPIVPVDAGRGRTRGGGLGRRLGLSPSRKRVPGLHVAAGVLAIALVAAGALGAVGTPATPTLTPGPGPDGVGNDTATGTAIGETAGAGVGMDAGDADAARTTTVRFGAFPPGVSEGGAIDTEALATAHAAVVAEREYRLQLTYDERRDGRTIATVRTIVTAESPTVFHVTRTVVGTPVGPTASLETAFADGRKRYRLANATRPTYVVTGFEDPPRYRRMAKFLAGLLEGEATIVDRIEREGQRRVRVRVRRDDGETVTATIGADGAIRRLEATLPLEDGRRGRLVVTLRFADVQVDRPLWFVEGDPVAQTTAEATTAI